MTLAPWFWQAVGVALAVVLALLLLGYFIAVHRRQRRVRRQLDALHRAHGTTTRGGSRA